MSSATLQDYGGGARTALEREIAGMAPWFHNLHLPDGTQTAPHHPLGDFPNFKWRKIAARLPKDLSGWSVLDIGCNAGFYSFALAARGADVLGIDSDERYLRQARWAQRRFEPRGALRFDQRHIYSLLELDEQFDIVLFQGVLYHLRYPLLGLDIAAGKARKLFLFQSLSISEADPGTVPADLGIHEREKMLTPGWPKLWFVEKALAGDRTNWWVPNRAAAEAMLRSAGLAILEQPTDETYLCRPSGLDEDRAAWLGSLRRSS